MALQLSDDEDGWGPSTSRAQRRPRPTNTTLFGSELPSFDTNSGADQSFNRSSNARASATGARIDLADLEADFENDQDETKVRLLMRHWMGERLAPDLLPWQGELVGEILEMLQSQNEIATQLQSNENTTEDEHFAVMLVQIEVERIKFVLKSYLRTRLQKVVFLAYSICRFRLKFRRLKNTLLTSWPLQTSRKIFPNWNKTMSNGLLNL